MVDKGSLRKVVSQWITQNIPYTIERNIPIPTDLGIIVSIIGPRRAGKTFLMYSAMKKLIQSVPRSNILYANFEHESLVGMTADELDDLLTIFIELSAPQDNFKIYLFLDEIQVVPNWGKWVNRMYESKRFRIFISGSSSKLLSSELSSELRGRTIDIVVLPMSFSEFLSAKNIPVPELDLLIYNQERGKLLGSLNEYIIKGGYPETLGMSEYHGNLLRSYIDTTIVKDVGERFRIEPSILKVFVNYCFKTYSKQISGTKIYNYLKSLNYSVSHDFPLKLIDYFAQVFFLYTVNLYSFSFKKSTQHPRKLYLVDTGLINVMDSSQELGKNMENVVFLELYRRMCSGNKFEIHYWKEYGKTDGLEVDFVLSNGNEVQELINVTYANSQEDIREREFKSLFKASRELGCKKLTVITWDFLKEGDIEYVPLWYWLLRSSI